MNYKITNSILVHRHLAEHPTVKHILTVLATHANAEGECWLRLSTIMDETSRKQRCTEDSLDRAEAAGFFTVLQRGRGLQGSTTYKLHPDQATALPTLAQLARRSRPSEAASEASSQENAAPAFLALESASAAEISRQMLPKNRQVLPENQQGLPKNRQGLPIFEGVYKDEVLDEVLSERVSEAARARTRSPEPKFSESSSSPIPTAPRPELQPSPFEDGALSTLAEIGGVNRRFPSPRDAQHWPAAVAALEEALEMAGVPRTEASGMLREFRAGWLAPDARGHARTGLFLSQIATHLLPWVQAAYPLRTDASEPTQENPHASARPDHRPGRPVVRPASYVPAPRHPSSSRGLAPISQFADGSTSRRRRLAQARELAELAVQAPSEAPSALSVAAPLTAR